MTEKNNRKEALRRLLESELQILPHVDEERIPERIRQIESALDKIKREVAGLET